MASHPHNTPTSAIPEPALKRLLRTVQRQWPGATDSSRQQSDQDTGCPSSAPSPASLEKRSQPRILLKNTPVQVTDGCLCATARIDNISAGGLCLGDLPENLYRSVGHLTVFSSENPGLPVLQVEPRWERSGWDGRTIGVAILNASESWRLFFLSAAGQVGA
jgi:hypothetical protein